MSRDASEAIDSDTTERLEEAETKLKAQDDRIDELERRLSTFEGDQAKDTRAIADLAADAVPLGKKERELEDRLNMLPLTGRAP